MGIEREYTDDKRLLKPHNWLSHLSEDEINELAHSDTLLDPFDLWQSYEFLLRNREETPTPHGPYATYRASDIKNLANKMASFNRSKLEALRMEEKAKWYDHQSSVKTLVVDTLNELEKNRPENAGLFGRKYKKYTEQKISPVQTALKYWEEDMNQATLRHLLDHCHVPSAVQDAIQRSLKKLEGFSEIVEQTQALIFSRELEENIHTKYTEVLSKLP